MSTLRLAAAFFLSFIKSRRRLVLDNLALRQQVIMLRQSMKKPRPSMADKLFWILFSRYVDGWRQILYGLHPDTVVRWHRQGFRLYWRWKSRRHGPGRPAIDATLRKLIREMQASNIGWGAPATPHYLMRDRDAIYGEKGSSTDQKPGHRRDHQRTQITVAEPLC